jgi:hypothetical protein
MEADEARYEGNQNGQYLEGSRGMLEIAYLDSLTAERRFSVDNSKDEEV